MPKLFTREEARRRRMRFQIFAGMFDFIALIAGIIVVILCIIYIFTDSCCAIISINISIVFTTCYF